MTGKLTALYYFIFMCIDRWLQVKVIGFHISAAVDRASWLGRPCGLVNFEFFKSINLALRFISVINAFCLLFKSSEVVRSEPAQKAN